MRSQNQPTPVMAEHTGPEEGVDEIAWNDMGNIPNDREEQEPRASTS